MSRRTVPRTLPLYSRPDVALYFHALPDGMRGDQAARLLWWFILAHTPWDTIERPTWANNATLARESGLRLREVERALSVLRRGGLVETSISRRPGASRPVGRVLRPALRWPVVIRVPEPGAMERLWAQCRSIRARPVSLVATAAVAYVLACDFAGEHVDGTSPLGCSQGDYRRLLGARASSGWNRRVADLVTIGVLARDDRDLLVRPPKSWGRGQFRVMPPAPDDIPF